MNTNFNDLPWHDANLQFIYIDRQKPGEKDTIKLLIEWPESNSTSNIEFNDCYALTLNMNFGIVACESILTAECSSDSEELRSIKKKWSRAGINLEGLKCYKIITNSTNSIINIYALDFRMVNVNPSGSV
jgi:hypothetical protein